MDSSQSRPKILVVDDNSENRALAQAALEDEDYTVVLAASGEEGVRAFEASAPDCILLDVRMPGMDGFDVCSRIRSLPGGNETPILFLTALRDVDTFDRALLAGGDDFLTKPVRPTELIARTQAALKLRRLNAELREHYAIVRRQRDDLMRLQLQKERLMAFVVHDLKNPVSTMDLHAQVLARDRNLPQQARESIAHIREAARLLSRLILNLLDISKSEEGRLVAFPRSIDLEALSLELVEAQALKAEAAGVSLRREIGAARAHGDLDLIRRVLENLIDNALRHSSSGGEVALRASGSDAGVELSVSDQGPGIPSELHATIFEPFVQLASREQNLTRTGRGLGLAFCKAAVDAHGGKLSVESSDAGAVFRVWLPGSR